MPTPQPTLPFHDIGHDRSYSPSLPRTGALRCAAAVFGALLLAGCLIAPMPAGPAGEADAGMGTGPGVEATAPRSQASESRQVPACRRVWSDAKADSTWFCPDPKPPAPDFGGGG